MEHTEEYARIKRVFTDIKRGRLPLSYIEWCENRIDWAWKWRRITHDDYEHYDYIIAMDRGNLRSLHAMFADDPAGKISLLMDYTKHPREIADPWYTRDFETAWREISEGCEALLKQLTA